MSPKNGKESKQTWVRTCPQCEATFQTERVDRRFCSNNCRAKAWQKKYPRIDPETGEVKQGISRD
jgi:protein-arginine kinase activator protein McsA